jgi:radical SAM superfamily enzyme YgiQ (UPF0313 family)
MKVLLVEPSFNWPHHDKPWAPWGKMQLAAYLRKHMAGVDVHIMDNAFFNGTDAGIRHTIGTELSLGPADVIGIGGMTLQRNDALRIARVIHGMYPDPALRPLMVAGGVHFTFCPEDAHELFDAVVLGEGEQTMLEICVAHREGLSGIKGCSYRGADGWTTPERREFLDLGMLPLPAFDLLPWFKDYNDGFFNGERHPMILTGRGCPFNCEFCASPQLYQRRVRTFSPEWVVDCMQEVRKHHPGKGFRVMDDTFALSNRRVTEVCEAITKRFGRTRMTCLTHCDTVDRPTLQLMYDAGFFVTALGIESGSDRVLKLINKGVTVEQAAESIQTTRSTGMFVEGLFMLGNIGEDEQSCLDTIEFARKYNHPRQYPFPANWNWFQFATPFPGSRFYANAGKYGEVVTTDYNRYHHQEPVYIPAGMTAEQLMRLRAMAFSM